MNERIEIVRTGLRKFNRWARVLSSDPYNLGLSLSQSGALVDLERFGSLRPATLAKLLNLDRSSISRLIAKLAGADLIVIDSIDQDGRGKTLHLAPKGFAALKKINKISNESILKVFEFLSVQDQNEVVRTFEKLAVAVKRAEEKYGGMAEENEPRG